jgi:hypothetical protein
MAMGINRPGFQLLSLVSAPNPQQQLHTPCVLPDQLGIYIWGYAVLGALSLVAVLIANVFRIRWEGRNGRGRGRERMRDWQRVRSGTPTGTEEAIGLMSVKVDRPSVGVANARRATLEAEFGGTRGRIFSASGDEADGLDEREGEKFVNGMVDGAGNGYVGVTPHTRFLPAPSHHRPEQQRDHRTFSWTFSLGNRRRRVSIASVCEMGRSFLRCGCRRKGGIEKRYNHGKKGLVSGFMSDVKSAAWPPVGVFLAIAWWMFW